MRDGAGFVLALAGGVAVHVVVVSLLPREERAQLAAGRLDRVRLALRAEREELGGAGVLVGDEALGEGADWMSASTAFMFSLTAGR